MSTHSPSLAAILDTAALQSLLDDFHALTSIPVSIIDLEGTVLVGVGWQDVCLKFHRANPTSRRNCIESDTQLVSDLTCGECRMYKCKNQMWDIATPIFVSGRKVGNVFSGQFLFDDEVVDTAVFRSQARRFGFDEATYLSSLEQVPRLSRAAVETGMAFLTKLAHMVSLLGYRNLELAQALEHRQALAKSLRESRDLLAASEEIAHLGSWKLEISTNQLSWSDEVYRIFGLRPQEFPPTYEAFLEMVHPDDRTAVHEAYSSSVRDGQSSYEITHRVIRRNSGEVRWVHEKCSHVRDGGGRIVRSVGMVQDVTDTKHAQDELQRKNRDLVVANRAWEEFAFVVSHDLQEPLRTINIFAQLLLRRPGLRDDTEATRCVEYIGGGVSRLEALLRDLLSYVSTSARQDESGAVADLNICFDSAVQSLEGYIRESGAIVSRTDLPLVRGGQRQLTQVFQNLLANAIKYRRPDVPPEVVVSCDCQEGECVVAVRDNGIGFDPDYADRIFGLFKRLHRNEYPGNGVGLAICRRILDRCGGRIWASSDGPGRGASFSFAVSLASRSEA